MGDQEIRRIVYSLLTAGLIEMVRVEGEEKALPGLETAMPGKDKTEQKKLVSRLIGRIRSL